ncbi:MAG: NADH-quinone oxidoreductase subunit J [Flammeovirgaceae bacterium]
MSITEWVFYFFGGTALLAAIFILINRNVLYNAFFLLLSFLSIAAIYVFAGADFIAVTQIMVYVGGILVLLIFGVMFTNRQKQQAGVAVEHKNQLLGLLLGMGLFIFLAYGIKQTTFENTPLQTAQTKIPELGVGLMTTYLIPFELAAILLLAALIGAALIAWKGSQET